MADFVIRQGDTASTLAYTLEDSTGAAVDIQGATVTFTLTPVGAGDPIIDAAAASNDQVTDGTDGSLGKVSYDWVAADPGPPAVPGDTDVPGYYLGSWAVTYSGGQIQTYPNEGYILIHISPTAPTGNQLYIQLEEMKQALTMTGQSYADADLLRACTAASSAIDQACRPGSHFYQATETRYYTPDDFNSTVYRYNPWREHRLEIDDIVSVTSLTIDTNGDGSYATTWIEGTDFWLDPANAAVQGLPFEELLIRQRSGRFLPRVQRAIKIEGVFGWPAVPPEVKQYAQLFAAQLALRARQAPFGILMQGLEIGATARLMRVDPDFDRLLGSLQRPKLFA